MSGYDFGFLVGFVAGMVLTGLVLAVYRFIVFIRRLDEREG